MNDLIILRGTALASASLAVRRAIEAPEVSVIGPREAPAERAARERRGDPCPTMVVRAHRAPPTPAMVAEARALLPELDAMLAPAEAGWLSDQVDHFCDMLSVSVANPPNEKALMLKKGAICVACGDLPRGIWTDALTRDAMRRFKFFPSVAELMELLEARANSARDIRARARAMANYRPAPREAEWVPPTPEEKAAVAASMARMRAERFEARQRDQAAGQVSTLRDVTLQGSDRVEAYEHALEAMTPAMREFMAPHVAAMRTSDGLRQSAS